MPTRGYVLIFVFWALLTIITPTLVSWSASAKPNLVAPGETLLEMKVNRRMMGSVETAAQLKNGTRKAITRATAPSPAAAPAPAPAAGHDVLS